MSRFARVLWWGMAILAAILMVMALNIPVAALAHDHNRPDLDDWYPTLRSPGGGPCCGGPKVDATTLDDADWETRDGHYRVRVDGEWIDVPDDKVVQGPNRAGHTLVWLYHFNGQPFVRCFMPGAMI